MKKKRRIWVPVVTGLIRKNNQVLVGLRPEDKSLPGVWEFPGGKIEPGESPEQALQRELNEELGIMAEIGPLKFAATHHYGETGILILFFEVLYWKGEAKPIHHNEIKWITVDELKQLSLPEANRKVLDRLVQILS